MTRTASIAAFALTLMLPSSLHAQEMRRSGGGGGGLPPYDVAKESKVVGEVMDTEVSESQNGPAYLVINLKVDGRVLRVITGPQGWMKELGAVFTAGATIEAIGVSNGMHFKGDQAMMVRQIKVGAKTIAVRGADGTPAWEK